MKNNLRIYFTSDLHGSDKCWKKFLAAPQFYGADIAIIGGDLTGKFIVPIIKHPDGTADATFLGIRRTLQNEKAIETIKWQIADSGCYPYEMLQDEYERFKMDEHYMDDLFKGLILDRLERWVDYADDRFTKLNARCFVSAGNDDLFEADNILHRSKTLEMCDGRVVDLGQGIEMLGLGYSNITPWNCPRDIPEEELLEKIIALTESIKRMEYSIFNIHVPPYSSFIDFAPKLNEKMQVVLGPGGEPEMVPVGSTAVREAILRFQPFLGVHGHIHESKGIRKLGRTTVVNPGSEYGEGILRGALIDIDIKEHRLKNIDLVSG